MHNISYRVYYEDTDAAGIVYYANYLKFAERARTELVRDIGIIQSEMLQNEGIGFVVKKVEANYLNPAKLDDLITIETSILDFSAASITMQQLLKKGDDLLVEMKVQIVIVNSHLKPTRITDDIKTKLMKFYNTEPLTK